MFLYGLIALAFVMLVWWTFNFVRTSARIETPVPAGAIGRSQEWPRWLEQAQDAAAQGRWREGVHCAYWCAVFFLETKGAWRIDRARTPREYLRLLPPSSEDRATLSALTGQFEVVWYGSREADVQAFTESIANLKKMGCPAA
jgi:hypothetical protein